MCDSEQEILREEMESCRLMKEKMKSRVAELEDEVRKFREAHELEKQKISMEDEVNVFLKKLFEHFLI